MIACILKKRNVYVSRYTLTKHISFVWYLLSTLFISDMTNTTYLSSGVRELLFSVSSTRNSEENDQVDLSISKIRQYLSIEGTEFNRSRC